MNTKQDIKPEIDVMKDESSVETPLFASQIQGMLDIVTVAPTGSPRNFSNQIVLYTDSLTSPTVYRLYVFIPNLNTWHYVALT